MSVAPVHELVRGQACCGQGCLAPSLGPLHLPLPPCPSPAQSDPEGEGGEHQSSAHRAPLAQCAVVAPSDGDDGGPSSVPAPLQGGLDSHEAEPGAPIPGASSSSSPSRHPVADLDEEDLSFLSCHLAKGTLSGYNCVMKKFTSFCSPFGLDPLTCPPSLVVKYLRSLYEEGAEYSTVNLHRSAISKFHCGFDGQTVGSHPLVKQAVRAVFRLKPPLPKYKSTFDVNVIFDYLSGLPGNQHLDLKTLSLKTLLLTIYSTLFRVSSMARLIPDISEHRDHVVLHLHALGKQSKPEKLRVYVNISSLKTLTSALLPLSLNINHG